MNVLPSDEWPGSDKGGGVHHRLGVAEPKSHRIVPNVLSEQLWP